MPVDLLIARWLSVFWLVCGVSHALYPALWARLLLPLRERNDGGFILGGMGLPVGLLIVLGHNVWVWDLPVIVTVAGWLSTSKCVVYLLAPRAHQAVIRRASGQQAERGFVGIGVVMIILGALTAYDAFWRRGIAA